MYWDTMKKHKMVIPNASERSRERQEIGKQIENVKIETRFGRNVRKLRKSKKITQEELACMCNCYQHYISELERGKRNISLRAAEMIAHALGVEIQDLL